MFIIIKSNRAFTIIEIMIVLVILSVVLAIAIPNYIKSNRETQKTVCIANLEKIDAAIDQWALENHILPGTEISGDDEQDIYTNYITGGKPRCPRDGEYTLHALGVKPQVTCSLGEQEGHELPN